MARDILKVRKVGGTLVVTLTQGILDQIPLSEGDRVLIEALPPKRILISKEESSMANTQRTELELAVLEARRQAIESEISAQMAEYNTHNTMASGDFELSVKEKTAQRDKVAVEIAQKRLALFDLQGA